MEAVRGGGHAEDDRREFSVEKRVSFERYVTLTLTLNKPGATAQLNATFITALKVRHDTTLAVNSLLFSIKCFFNNCIVYNVILLCYILVICDVFTLFTYLVFFLVT